MSHSKIVGGSSAERVIKCPASVKLAQQMPAQEENEDMREGTRRHELLQAVLEDKIDSRNIDDEKVLEALDLFDNEVDPHAEALFDLEKRVHYIWNPDVFGTVDMIGVLDKDTAYVLDWKTGDGHQVTAEENYQLLFYAAAALSCDHWAFRDRTFVELIIVQPPVVRRWVTDKARLREFEHELRMALAAAERDTAPHAGEHCKWCPAKIICPAMNGARDRLVKAELDALPIQAIAAILQDAERVEAVIDAARKAALAVLEKGGQVPGYKLVPKRAQRSWANEQDAKRAIEALGVAESELMDLKSPAQVEKVLKTHKLKLPEGLTVSVSSGDTIAPESDPRPAKVLIGQQLTAALSKLV